MKNLKRMMFTLIMFLSVTLIVRAQGNYKNFEVSVYSRAYETAKMGDDIWLPQVWDEISRQVKVDKIYLETHRDLLVVDEATLLKAKKFFESKGIKTAGGITLTINESNNFQTFCYSNPEDRKKVKEIVEFTAKHFDELILDDFFFTTCKCDLCIKAKGNLSWTDFRLKLMTEAARDLIIGPAKAVNPKIKVVIKYPNWYEHFQGCGFNLETEPKMFDGVYAGTETRDPSWNQHLQAYEGYSIIRYFDNISSGRNGGGWVDGPGSPYMDRYAEQLWLTLFAKTPEITLFDISGLQRKLMKSDRGEWQNHQSVSFNYDEMMKPIPDNKGVMVLPTTIARAAGYTFEMVDKILGELGNPIGVKSYKPFHSTGDDFLQNYMGMIGIPMDIVSVFPEDEPIVFLTEQAKFDPNIISKIKKQLVAGKDVMITSNFLKAMENKGLNDIAEIRYTDQKALVKEFTTGFRRSNSDQEIMIPQIKYITNDSWELISGLDDTNGWPILHRANYSKGKLYVLTIPENFIDLYHLPVEVTTAIKEILTAKMPVMLEGPGYTSLFVYDNKTAIVESFANVDVQVHLRADNEIQTVKNIQTGEVISGTKMKIFQGWNKPAIEKQSFELTIKPHSFVALKLQESK
jgi:hypothetical protein